MNQKLYALFTTSGGMVEHEPGVPVVFTSKMSGERWLESMSKIGMSWPGCQLRSLCTVQHQAGPVNDGFHHIVRRALATAGMRQNCLANKLGVSRAVVSQWLMPEHRTKAVAPRAHRVDAIASLLSLDQEQLLVMANHRRATIARMTLDRKLPQRSDAGVTRKVVVA
jgi:predicted transcriptional regulator